MKLIIPNLTYPHTDETIFSYAYRLSKMNSYNNFSDFLKNLSAEAGITDSRTQWTYDGYRIFAPLLSCLKPETHDIIIQESSFYPYHAVFLTKHQQAIITDRLFNKTNIKTSPRQAALITNVYCCSECMKEDYKEYGHYYMHRAHNLPGVTVCHKHHIPLYNLNNGQPIEPTSDATEYAEFSAALLWAKLETDIDLVQQATIKRIPQRIPGLVGPLEKYIKQGLYSSRNKNIPNIIRILMNTFGSVASMASCLKEDNDIIRKFIDTVIKEGKYEVFKPFSRVLIQMRQKSSGETFYTTPEGFLTGWKRESNETQQNEPSKPKYSTLQEQIKALTGNEYTVISIQKTRNTTAEIRHNTCGLTKTYNIKHFLTGLRCPRCTSFIPESAFPDMVNYMTSGQYNVTRKRNSKFEITEENGEKIELTPRHFLQEILRPTKSDILPAPVQHLKKDWLKSVFNQQIKKPSRISSKDFLKYLKSIYNEDDLLFIEDLHKELPEEYKQILLGNINRLFKNGYIYRVGKGIYSLTPNIEAKKILVQRTILRKKQRIGIYNSKSLAYEIGILKNKPKIIYIMTNSIGSGTKIPTNPTYKCHLYGLTISFTKSPVTINNENYRYLMVLQALRYCNHYGHDGLPYVTNFIKQNNLSKEGFQSLLPYYTKRIQKQLKTIMETL